MNSRDTAPVRIGVPTSRPNSVSLRPSCFWIWMPMIEKSVQTAKQAMKAIGARPQRLAALTLRDDHLLQHRFSFLFRAAVA